MAALAFDVGGVSVPGRDKEADRDRWAVSPDGHVIVVADGMGDTAAAAAAAELTVATVVGAHPARARASTPPR